MGVIFFRAWYRVKGFTSFLSRFYRVFISHLQRLYRVFIAFFAAFSPRFYLFSQLSTRVTAIFVVTCYIFPAVATSSCFSKSSTVNGSAVDCFLFWKGICPGKQANWMGKGNKKRDKDYVDKMCFQIRFLKTQRVTLNLKLQWSKFGRKFIKRRYSQRL